jgi:hypothetical protein
MKVVYASIKADSSRLNTVQFAHEGNQPTVRTTTTTKPKDEPESLKGSPARCTLLTLRSSLAPLNDQETQSGMERLACILSLSQIDVLVYTLTTYTQIGM